jgi:hypothetical protein
MPELDDGSAAWALKDAERKLRDADEALRLAVHRTWPMAPPGSTPVALVPAMTIHRAGKLAALAHLVQTGATLVQRIRRGNA